MSAEQIVIAYLVIAVWWNSYMWIRSNRLVKQLTKERDKYKKAWTNGDDLILWEKNEKNRNTV